MSRTYLERKHLTECYQQKQIKRLGPFKDYNRRPEQTFYWMMVGYDQFPYYDREMNDYPSPAKIGFFRNHNYEYCGCRVCRAINRDIKTYSFRWSLNYYKQLKIKQEIKEMKQEVVDFFTSS
jgi:hypothetical protein